MPRSHLCTTYSGDIDETVASITRDLIHWRSLADIDGDGTKCKLMYKVLQRIRVFDLNAYEPRVLSIGPYHHGAPPLVPMEKEKWLCLDYVLKLNCSRSLHDYLAAITALERDARFCYAEDITMNSRTFVEMLLLDSCFILVCLNGIEGIGAKADHHKGYSKEQDLLTETVVYQSKISIKGKEITTESIISHSCSTSDDFVLQVEQSTIDARQQSNKDRNMEPYLGQNQENVDLDDQWYNSSAVYDLLLLENQIPFFVVAKVFELLIYDESTTHRLLTDNIAKFIEGILLPFPSAIHDTDKLKNFDHLLHLCYLYFKPTHCRQHNHHIKKKVGYFDAILRRSVKYLGINSDSQENEGNLLSNEQFVDVLFVKQLKRWRRAEEYYEAGVEFSDRVFDEHDPHSLLDIEFRNGILHIPCLPIDDKSGTLFRNLLAFEQSSPALGNDMASYVYFMSQLISVPDDVALLSRKGIIVHQLGSDEEVSSLFTRLFEYVIFYFSGEHYLKSLCHTLEAHYQNRVNRWMAWLWHKHFGNPWLGFTALASVLMVLCSIGQTILAFLSYMSMS